MNFLEYYHECMNYAASLIAFGAEEYTSINIIGFNSPEWHISFLGSLFCRCLPTGIYTTNNQNTCEYIAKNSECKIVISENMEYAQRYLKLLQNGEIKYIIIYDENEDLSKN